MYNKQLNFRFVNLHYNFVKFQVYGNVLFDNIRRYVTVKLKLQSFYEYFLLIFNQQFLLVLGSLLFFNLQQYFYFLIFVVLNVVLNCVFLFFQYVQSIFSNLNYWGPAKSSGKINKNWNLLSWDSY
eukprot:TRINITY_DN21346_c0_g1_i1.p2 TRINITY_DN21346_c0_g1~~TRINITY_DN21346_c0_g1_i1.p2  ORF type:complete len:126 (-),score=0.81 TRINITY_DN21346_c0_g1_i1:540-917(-)